MACLITISNITGTLVSGSLNSIQVTGTAASCDQIEVTLRCSGTAIQQTVLNLSGTWAAIFGATDIQAAKCFCQKSITVSAHCVSPNNPQCFDTKTVVQLPCSPPCCNVQILAAVDPTCNQQQRKVTFSVASSCPTPVSAQLDFGDGSPAITFAIAPSATQSLTHFYVAGTHNAILHIPGCADQPVTLTVPTCCPTVTFNTLAGNCKTDGTQPMSLAAVIVPPPGGALIQANLVEGSTVLASGTSSSAMSPLTLTYSGDFPSGSHTICVQVVQPSGCAPQCTTFTVNCIGACCLSDGNCKDGVTQEQCQSLSGTYMGHGTTCADVKCPPPQEPDPCKKTFRKWFCPLLLALMTFGTAIGLALVMLSSCGGFASVATTLAGIGATLVAMGVIALLLFWLFCTKCVCGWFYLFLWRVLFGVGIIVTVFAGCCPSLLLPGLAMILLGIVFLFLWKNHCHKTLCELLAEVVFVMAVYILPAISMVLGFGSVAACLLVLFTIFSFNFTFLLLVSIAFATIIVYQQNNC